MLHVDHPTQPGRPCWSAAPVNKAFSHPFYHCPFRGLSLPLLDLSLHLLKFPSNRHSIDQPLSRHCSHVLPGTGVNSATLSTLVSTHCRRLSSQVESVVNFVDSTQRVHKDDILRTLHTILKADFSDAIK